ncbi:MAG: carboxypeptidase [Sulfobacillus acidophilus]|uniref:Carboxypeptidase n=1 Tax=Sulfobacillus acidophilus TaxID=53633 RepID=A0A2T2WJ94_9FIRM|nr:MAG: carboxypeptidase [Sulfobacillus acidophilus]
MAILPVSDQMRAGLKHLVELESPSGDVAGITRVVDYIAAALSGVGAVQRLDTAAGPLLEVSRGVGGALILGHADTVWPLGTIEEMPFVDKGDWVYGPGTLDMKGGLILAMQALLDLPGDTPFTFLVTPDEEVGSEASRAIIEDRARRARLVLVLESGMPGGAIKIGRAGVGDFHLTITGIESHAGLAPDQGASAIRELAHQILWLDALANPTAGTTVNVGVVQGGSRSNVVAGRVYADIDIRVTTQSERDRLTQALSVPAQFDDRCRVQYLGEFNRPPMEPTPASQAWVARASQRWQAITGEPLQGGYVGGASDGNFTAVLAPTLDGLGPIGQGAHARHEGVEWRFMVPRLQLISDLIVEAGKD